MSGKRRYDTKMSDSEEIFMKKDDRRIRKTKKAIKEGLAELMLEKKEGIIC